MAKRPVYKTVTPYYLIMIKYGSKQYYSGADRIMKNSSLEEAKNKAREIWGRLPSPYFLEIRNELNITMYTYATI